MRIIILLVCALGLLLAKVDYSQMSNEELIALIGYVQKDKQKEFEKELEKRKATFTKQEREKYLKSMKNKK